MQTPAQRRRILPAAAHINVPWREVAHTATPRRARAEPAQHTQQSKDRGSLEFWHAKAREVRPGVDKGLLAGVPDLE